MGKSLFSGAIGPEANYDLKFVDGKLQMLIKYDGEGVDVGVELMVDPDYFCDKLAEAIPGKVDDQIIRFLKAAFLSQ